MDKVQAIHSIIEVLKPRVVCRFPKQRKSKVFREISTEAFAICSKYVSDRNAGILADTLKRDKKKLYRSAFEYGKDHWTKVGIEKAETFLVGRPWWWRLWWVINAKKIKLGEGAEYEGKNTGRSNKQDNSI